MIDRLTRCKRVLVTTHVRPDGDALGTCAALVLTLAVTTSSWLTKSNGRAFAPRGGRWPIPY